MNLQNYKSNFSQKHLLTLQSYSKEEIMLIISLAQELKSKGKNTLDICKGKTLAMIFTKPSTRTRVSFEVGISQLGGRPMFLSSNDLQLGKSETIEDTAKVLSRMVDGIMIRTFLQSDVEALAENGTIPIINGLTDDFHPCQALADILTYYENKKTFTGKITFLGDGNNVANSLMLICSKLGLDFSIASPKNYEPTQKVINWALENAKVSGSKITISNDPIEAAKDADCIYADVFASMGQESEKAERLKIFKPYQVNDDIVSHAKPDYIFMHCLPAHRGEEVTSSIIDGAHSVVFDEAENRLHAQKAVLALLMG